MVTKMITISTLFAIYSFLNLWLLNHLNHWKGSNRISVNEQLPLSSSYFCRSRASCNQNRTLCHANADCVFNNRLREYECVCSYSYFGDGFDCRPLEKHGEEHIIVAQGMSLLNLSVEAGKKNGKLLLTKELQTPVGLDVDCLEG